MPLTAAKAEILLSFSVQKILENRIDSFFHIWKINQQMTEVCFFYDASEFMCLA